MDIVAFLAARLDEDQVAAEAVRDNSAPWDGQWESDGASAVRTHNGHVLVYACHGGNLKPGLAVHIARHAPARVLRGVATGRAVAAMHEQAERWTWGVPRRPDDPQKEPAGYCGTCQVEDGVIEGSWPCDTLKHLVAVYTDHPDYDPAWRVE